MLKRDHNQVIIARLCDVKQNNTDLEKEVSRKFSKTAVQNSSDPNSSESKVR